MDSRNEPRVVNIFGWTHHATHTNDGASFLLSSHLLSLKLSTVGDGAMLYGTYLGSLLLWVLQYVLWSNNRGPASFRDWGVRRYPY